MPATLLDVQCVAATGEHLAFTDLTSWCGHYYLAYRQALSHHPMTPGHLVVRRSPDAVTWDAGVTVHTGGDDRDPHFVCDGARRLGLMCGTYAYADVPLRTLHPQVRPQLLLSHVTWSRDGTWWGLPLPLFRWQYWIWSVVPSDGELWRAAAYHSGDAWDASSIHYLCSDSGTDWLHAAVIAGPSLDLGEPFLWPAGPKTLGCLVRHETQPAVLFRATHPYGKWTGTPLEVLVHSPVVRVVGERTFVAGRSRAEDLPRGVADAAYRYRKGAKHRYYTTLWELEGTTLRHLVTVPSAGDCGYPGLVADPTDDGTLLLSYYSQHERLPLPAGLPCAADVYVARIRV